MVGRQVVTDVEVGQHPDKISLRFLPQRILPGGIVSILQPAAQAGGKAGVPFPFPADKKGGCPFLQCKVIALFLIVHIAVVRALHESIFVVNLGVIAVHTCCPLVFPAFCLYSILPDHTLLF